MILIVILVLVFLVAAIIGIKQIAKEKAHREVAIVSRTDFTESKVVKDDIASFHFAVDEDRHEVYCYSASNTIRFHYEDIVAAEIRIDGGSIVTKKSASMGGALVGGLIAGGVGAVVGGSSMRKSKSYREVKAVNVHILLRDSKAGTFDIKCLPFPTNSDNDVYSKAINNAQTIFDILRLAMDKVQVDQS